MTIATGTRFGPYEMLLGKRTFARDPAIEVMNAILIEDQPELGVTRCRACDSATEILA